MSLCLWSPTHPLSKLLAIQDHAQNLEEQLWIGGRRKVSIISHRPVIRRDLKQERSVFRGSVSTFLQLVVVSWLFLDLVRPNNCGIPCKFAQADPSRSCLLLCDVTLAGGDTMVEDTVQDGPSPYFDFAFNGKPLTFSARWSIFYSLLEVCDVTKHGRHLAFLQELEIR